MTDQSRVEPPHNIEAEQQVLGALLSRNDLYDKVSQTLSADSFYDPVHRDIYEVIVSRISGDQLASPISIRGAFDGHEGLKHLGGPAYLTRLAGAAIAPSQVVEYVQILTDLASKRDLIDAMRDARERIWKGRDGLVDIASSLETKTGAVLSKTSTKPLIRSHLSSMIGAIQQINSAFSGEKPTGISTGLTSLDSLISYMRPGNLILLAGRPAMGKTTVAQNIAFTAAMSGVGVFFASLEMSGEELGMRFLSRGLKDGGVNIPYNRLLTGKLSEKEMRAVAMEGKRQQSLPIVIGERDVRSLDRCRAAARRAKQTLESGSCPLGLIVVDYIGILDSGNPKHSTQERVSAASDFCKSLAMQHGVPVIACSQLSRSVEYRDTPTPMLSDLRDSGSLEQDADVVMFAYREAYYLAKNAEDALAKDPEKAASMLARLDLIRDRLDLIIAKQRSGGLGTVNAFADLATCHVHEDRAGSDGHLI